MYFQKWPFGVTPEKNAMIWADRKDLFNSMDELFQNFANRKRSYVQHLWGYLGAGKTHTVWHFSLILGQKQQLRFMYSKFPTHSRNFLELYRDCFIPSFDFETFAEKCSTLWEVYLSGKDEEQAFFRIRNQIAGKYDDFAQIVYNIAKIWSISPMKALRDPLFVLSRSWLSGAKIGRREMTAIGVMNNISDDGDAVLALGGILRLLTSSEDCENSHLVQPIVWIIDDSHVLFARHAEEQELIQRGIRRVVDECPSNLLIVMCFATPDPEKIREGIINELETVSSHSIVEVPPLSRQEAVLFITDLMNQEGFRKQEVTDKFYPYTKDGLTKAIEEIANKGVDLLPRNIIKCFDHLTDDAEKKKIEPIDAQFVNLFFKEKCVSKFCPLLS